MLRSRLLLPRSTRGTRRSAVIAAGIAVSAALALGLAGCTGATGEPDPVVAAPSTSAGSGASATAGASAAPGGASTTAPGSAGSFDPDATTAVAKQHFDTVVRKLLTTDPEPHGRDVIDALVAGGFAKTAMQLTPDQTTIGRAADSIEFSVLWKGDDCLVGQVGSTGYASTSAAVLGTGKCLVGTTRAIDW